MRLWCFLCFNEKEEEEEDDYNLLNPMNEEDIFGNDVVVEAVPDHDDEAANDDMPPVAAAPPIPLVVAAIGNDHQHDDPYGFGYEEMPYLMEEFGPWRSAEEISARSRAAELSANLFGKARATTGGGGGGGGEESGDSCHKRAKVYDGFE